jgi:UDP-3-O-[3-hydroxymyristoyl] glucosamine N-acyltransferase
LWRIEVELHGRPATIHEQQIAPMTQRTVNELARHVNGTVQGDGNVQISSVAGLAQAGAGQISFLANARYAKMLTTTSASAVLVAEPANCAAAQIVVKNPYYAFTQISILLHGHRQHPFSGVSDRASIDVSANIGEGTRIQDFAFISPNARVGRRCVIYAGVFIGEGAQIGDDCILYPSVVVYDGVRIGHRVIVQANSTIGGDGFGFATENGEHYKIPHLGRVELEDDVNIGSNCSVQSGVLFDTRVGRGTKTGDSVVIGHGDQIGPGCLIVSQAGVAGSTTLGRNCVLAGQVGIAGHLNIGNGVVIAAQSGVMDDLPDGAKVFGSPAFDMKQALKAYASLQSLPEFRKTLKKLEQRLDKLEAAAASPDALPRARSVRM